MQRYGSHPHMPPRLHCHCSILLIRTYYSSFFSPISSSSSSHLLVVVFSASPRNFPFRGGGGRKTPLSLSFTPNKPLGTNFLVVVVFRKDEKLFLITAMDLDLPQKRIEMEAGSSRKLQLPFASSSSSSSSSGLCFPINP